MNIQFKKATREAVKLKIAIDGPSGSGKTYGALALATGITNSGRIAVVDSENESASFYADAFQFDTVSFPDAQPSTLAAIIDHAVREKYDAIVIDSLSHVWQKVLADKDAYERANPKSNSWTNWGKFGAQWDGVIKHVLDAPIHIIATMRSKQAYEQVERDGKKKVVKLGLAPQVRDGAEYEFGIVFSVNEAHFAEATKDRTRMFAQGELVDLSSAKLHARLIDWMSSETPAADEAIIALTELAKHARVTTEARKAVTELASSGAPSAAKVERYTTRLREMIQSNGGAASAVTGAAHSGAVGVSGERPAANVPTANAGAV